VSRPARIAGDGRAGRLAGLAHAAAAVAGPATRARPDAAVTPPTEDDACPFAA
jgi:hypothetical protein